MGLETATILAIASVTATAVGTGVSVYSQQQQAKAQEAAAAANAKAMREAALAREAEATENAYRAHRDSRRKIAGLRARLAGTGTEINDGSNRDILGNASLRLETQIADQARAAQMDAQQIRHSADLTRWEGSQAAAASRVQSAGTVLQGFGSLASQSYSYQQQGAF